MAIWSIFEPIGKLVGAVTGLIDEIDTTDEEKLEKPSTVVIRATIFDNPFMPKQVKEENIKRWRKRGVYLRRPCRRASH